MYANNLKEMHRLLAYRAESPRAELRVTVTPRPDNHQNINRKIATLQCDGENHPFVYLINHEFVIANMLANYPVPVYINDTELRREPIPQQPSIIHNPAHLPDQPVPEERFLGKIREPILINPINVDGINYMHSYRTRDHISMLIPNPDVANELFQVCDYYRVRFLAAISTPPDSGDLYYIDGHQPTCSLTERSQQAANAYIQQVIAQALEIIGAPYTKEELDSLPIHQGWTDLNIMAQPGVTPITIGFNRAEHTANGDYRGPITDENQRPMAEALAQHLLTHPETGLVPIKPPYQNPNFTNLALADPQVTRNPDHLGHEPAPDEYRVSSISVDATVEHPDGTRKPLELHPELLFLGDLDNPLVLLQDDFEIDESRLTGLIFNAYYHHGFIRRDEDEERADRFAEKAASIASSIINGPEHAYTNELIRHWESFNPTIPRPQAFTAERITEIIYQRITRTPQAKAQHPKRC